MKVNLDDLPEHLRRQIEETAYDPDPSLTVETFWPALEQLLQGKPDVSTIADLMSDYWHLHEAIGDAARENPEHRRMLERMIAIQNMIEMDERGSTRQ